MQVGRSIHNDVDESYGSDTLVASSDYSQRGKRGQIVRLTSTSSQGAWSEADYAVKVVFTAGYSTAPGSLKALVANAVLHFYGLRKRRGKQSKTLSPGN